MQLLLLLWNILENFRQESHWYLPAITKNSLHDIIWPRTAEHCKWYVWWAVVNATIKWFDFLRTEPLSNTWMLWKAGFEVQWLFIGTKRVIHKLMTTLCKKSNKRTEKNWSSKISVVMKVNMMKPLFCKGFQLHSKLHF